MADNRWARHGMVGLVVCLSVLPACDALLKAGQSIANNPEIAAQAQASSYGAATRLVASKQPVRSCADPAVAAVSGEFRYGCYCGAYHPQIGIPQSLQSDTEIIGYLTRRLTEVAPVDAVDALCQVHDVCQAAYGFDRACNVYFARAMGAASLDYHARLAEVPRTELDTRNALLKCAVLTNAISGVVNGSLAPFARDRRVPAWMERYPGVVSDGVVLATLPFSAITYAAHGGRPFPAAGQRCD